MLDGVAADKAEYPESCYPLHELVVLNCVLCVQNARERILAALTDEFQTTKQLENVTGVPNTTVDREAKALVQAGLAVAAKAGNKNTYRLA